MLPVVLDFSEQLPIEVEVSQAQLTGEAGLLPIRQFDEAIRLTARFAAALGDARGGEVLHSNPSMVRQRIYGVLADYEDQGDHDTLRSDPAFKLVSDRLPNGIDLASQPTLSRFENAVSIADLWRLRDALCDEFLDAFTAPPARITLDMDAFDDPAHGGQQLNCFHGFYEQYQYLLIEAPSGSTCAETDMVALVRLRHGTCAASLGADDDLRYLTRRIRERFPDVEIIVRGGPVRRAPRVRRAADVRRVRGTAADAHPIAVKMTDLDRNVPAEALAGRDRYTWFNRRHHHDPLGEGFACTWHQRLIKAAAEITVSARRVLVRLSASWPFADEYRRISQAAMAHPRSP